MDSQHYAKWNKSDRERQLLYMWNLSKKKKNLIEKNLWLPEVKGGSDGELEEGGQKVQTSS